MSNSLAAVHPELIVEWSDRNLPLTPDSVTFGSNKKVWWKGTCGHEWETSVKARSNGEKCPICSGARVVTGINDLSTLKPKLASEWSEKNEIKPTEVSIGSHKKVIWQCKQGHEWTATVKSRTINGTGCPYCSHNKVLAGFNDLATVFPDVAAEWSDRNEKKPTEVTAFANSKIWWKCKTCGYEWNTLISTRSYGSKCPCCSGYVLVKGRNDLKTTHPNIVEEWAEQNFPLQPDEVNAKSRKNVWWHFGLKKPSMVLLEQVQTVNKEDLKDYIGTVDDEQLIRRINTMLKKTFGLWIYKKEKEENIRCLCPKCLSEYIDNPNYIVRRLNPFAKEKDRCDKCDKAGWDYIVTERNSVRKGKSGSYEK